MRHLSRLAAPAALIASLTFRAQTMYAQNFAIITDGIPGCNFRTGKLEAKCIPLFIAHLIQVLFSLISIFFILNVLYAGYQMAISYGQGNGMGEGKDRLYWSIAGVIVSVCSFLILDLVVTVISG